MRASVLFLCVALACAAALAPVAVAAPPVPFGHACVPRDGALFCPGLTDAERVPSFDGVPLDVDVWLPASGDGPFPTIAMLHGFGGSKTDFESGRSAYDARTFARAGYAAVLPTARGFGRSCGVADSRTAGCERGWMHVGDQRFEAGDVHWLLGLLVDQRVARPGGLGVTGVSYGAGTSLQLALLGNRIRRPDGGYAPWTSPAGTPLALAAAWPRWPWSDLADALTPNGRLGIDTYASPIGVPIKAYVDALYGVAARGGFAAAPGADPSADLTTWKRLSDQGEPFGAPERTALRQLHTYHGAVGIPAPKRMTPLLIQSGWTDDLFPVGQGLRAYKVLRGISPRAPVALQLGDLGHSRAANHPADIAAFTRQGVAFFGAHLGGAGRAPAPGSVTTFRQVCPRNAPSGGPAIRASSFDALARGELVFRHKAVQRVTSSGGDASLSRQLSPLTLDPCKGFSPDVARGTAIGTVRSPGVTLVGMTHVRADITVHGQDALVVARLWDVDPARGRQKLVDRGVVRLRSKHVLRANLNGNAYRFARGHRIKIELLGRDAPTYRAANDAFSVTVRNLKVTLPTRERRAGS
jgi:fermentation-respiration switch protein FrsA (DUF1100 family)